MSRKILSVFASLGLVIATFFLASGTAHAVKEGISGSTSWGPCEWYTSENTRYTTGHVWRVAALIKDTGKLGVKMRTQQVYTGETSPTRYFPKDTWEKFTHYKKGAGFRLQFTCSKPRDCGFWTCDRPSTDFQGTLRY